MGDNDIYRVVTTTMITEEREGETRVGEDSVQDLIHIIMGKRPKSL